MDRAREEIREAGGDVVALFMYRAEPTRNFCRQRKVSFDCFGDPEREAYHAVGLERFKASQYLGPKQAIGWLRAAAGGARGGMPKGDVAQAPGTFVVGRDGRVAFAHYNRDSADNPPVEAVLEAVRRAAGGR